MLGLALSAIAGCGDPVGAAPISAISPEAGAPTTTLSRAELASIASSYSATIERLDPRSGDAMYIAQQTATPLVHAIFTLGTDDQRARALAVTADLIRSLPTADQLREESAADSFDGFPIPNGRAVSRRHLFPMRVDGRLKMLSANAQQFSYLLSTLLRLAAQSRPAEGRSDRWEADLAALYGFLIDDILRFYWLEAPAWHWAGAYPNMRARTFARLDGDPKLAPRRFFRAFTDYDLHLFAIAADLKATQRIAPQLVRSPADRSLVADANAIGMRVLRARIDMGPEGRGFAFDRGMWDDNPSTQYAACRSPLPPPAPCPGREVTQDVSHAQRWPWWLQSFGEAARGTPDEPIIRKWRRALARQIGEKVIRFDADRRPLMTNFIDGRDGWYNLVTKDGVLSGHRPSSLTGWSMRYGAWALLAPLSARLADGYRAFCRVIVSDDPADITFRTRNYGAPGDVPSTGFASETDEFGSSSLYLEPCRIYRAMGLI